MLLSLTDRETSDAGTTTASFAYLCMCCRAGVTGFSCGGGVVAQSTEQVCREVEAADTASVARLVRGVCCFRVTLNAPLLCVVLVMYVLLWWWCWRGQAVAGLGGLRTPVVLPGVAAMVYLL